MIIVLITVNLYYSSLVSSHTSYSKHYEIYKSFSYNLIESLSNNRLLNSFIVPVINLIQFHFDFINDISLKSPNLVIIFSVVFSFLSNFFNLLRSLSSCSSKLNFCSLLIRFLFLRHCLSDMFAAIKRSTASGSNTNMSMSITNLTALSKLS